MSFEVSPCIGLTVPDPGLASRFYQEVLGMKLVGVRDGVELSAGTLRFFIDPGRLRVPVLELLTENLDKARLDIRTFGCEEVIWKGPEEANIVVDPFGFRWNIFECPEPDNYQFAPEGDLSPILPKIGLQTPYTIKAADFYADLCDHARSLSHGAWFVDGRFVRLRIEDLLPPGPAFFLDPGFDLTQIDPRATGEQAVAVDPYGLRWRPGPANPSDIAVVQTKAHS